MRAKGDHECLCMRARRVGGVCMRGVVLYGCVRVEGCMSVCG